MALAWLSVVPWWGYVLATPFALLLLLVVWIQISIRLPKKMTEKVLPNGLKIWQWTDAETGVLYKELFEDDFYSRGVIQVKPGDTVFDVGANIGMFALHAFTRANKQVTVHSFEPMPKIHAVCAANAARFDPQRKYLHTHQLGLSNQPANVMFEFHPHFSIWSTSDASFDRQREQQTLRDVPHFLRSYNKWLPAFIFVPFARWIVTSVLNIVEQVPAELSTMSTMIKKLGVERIDLLKVDVEGAELAVLQGVKDEDWPKIQQVVLEAESFAVVKQLRQLLESHGFTVTASATQRDDTPGVTSEVSCVMAVRK